MGYRVPDVAGSYQGQVDWAAIEAELARRYPSDTMPAGIVKLSEGVQFVDPLGALNVRALKALGKLAVGYHCITATSPVTDQARMFAALLEQYGCDGAMIDWERFGNPGQIATPAAVASFLRALQAVWWRPVLLYTASWVIGSVGGQVPAELAALPLVLGNPNIDDCSRWWPNGPTLWQYGQESAMPGIRQGALLDMSSGGPAFTALFSPTLTEEPMYLIDDNGSLLLRGATGVRRVNPFEDPRQHPDSPLAGLRVYTPDEVGPALADWVQRELAAYDRALAGATVDVDEAKLATDLRAELTKNPLVINLTGKGA